MCFVNAFPNGAIFLKGGAKPMKCPKCGSERTRDVVYGYLPFDLARDRDEGRVVWGGLFMPEDAKARECADCGARW